MKVKKIVIIYALASLFGVNFNLYGQEHCPTKSVSKNQNIIEIPFTATETKQFKLIINALKRNDIKTNKRYQNQLIKLFEIRELKLKIADSPYHRQKILKQCNKLINKSKTAEDSEFRKTILTPIFKQISTLPYCKKYYKFLLNKCELKDFELKTITKNQKITDIHLVDYKNRVNKNKLQIKQLRKQINQAKVIITQKKCEMTNLRKQLTINSSQQQIEQTAKKIANFSREIKKSTVHVKRLITKVEILQKMVAISQIKLENF